MVERYEGEQVEIVPLDDLIPYDGNAKRHTNEQIDAIQESISELDFTNPVIAWHDEDGRAQIVAGHARALAARKSGMRDVPVIFMDHLSDAERRALVLADNQISMMTGFDRETLKIELEDLRDEYDAEDFGFDPLDLADMEEGRASYETLSREELDAYSEEADEGLLSFNVMVRCHGQGDVERAAEAFGFDPESPKRFYRAEELIQSGRA